MLEDGAAAGNLPLPIARNEHLRSNFERRKRGVHCNTINVVHLYYLHIVDEACIPRLSWSMCVTRHIHRVANVGRRCKDAGR